MRQEKGVKIIDSRKTYLAALSCETSSLLYEQEINEKKKNGYIGDVETGSIGRGT